MYHIWASLLNSYEWYSASEADNAAEDFLAATNRTAPTSPKMQKGIDFEAAVCAKELMDSYSICEANEFNWDLVEKLREHFKGALQQVRCETVIETWWGDVKIYGVADFVGANKVADLKTTESYVFPKYLRQYQHEVYPLCLNRSGYTIDEFDYVITDFRSDYVEPYAYDEDRAISRILSCANQVIEFAENYRDKITNQKIFGG